MNVNEKVRKEARKNRVTNLLMTMINLCPRGRKCSRKELIRIRFSRTKMGVESKLLNEVCDEERKKIECLVKKNENSTVR